MVIVLVKASYCRSAVTQRRRAIVSIAFVRTTTMVSAPAPAKPVSTSTTPRQPQPTSLLVHLLLWAQCAAELLCFALGLVVEALVTYVLPSSETTMRCVGRAQRLGRRAVQAVLRGLRNALSGGNAKTEARAKKKRQ